MYEGESEWQSFVQRNYVFMVGSSCEELMLQAPERLANLGTEYEICLWERDDMVQVVPEGEKQSEVPVFD
jgi:hypothetical protein